jgi:hypothetical protein
VVGGLASAIMDSGAQGGGRSLAGWSEDQHPAEDGSRRLGLAVPDKETGLWREARTMNGSWTGAALGRSQVVWAVGYSLSLSSLFAGPEVCNIWPNT